MVWTHIFIRKECYLLGYICSTATHEFATTKTTKCSVIAKCADANDHYWCASICLQRLELRTKLFPNGDQIDMGFGRTP